MMKRAFAGATVLLLVTACGNERSGSYETEDGETVEYSVDADGADSSATITTEEGTATFRSGTAVGVDLPDGFTVYPGATIVSNSTMTQNDGTGSILIMQSGDQPEKLIAFYRKQAEAAGVEIAMEMKSGQGTMIGGEGEGDLVFTLNATEQDGGTNAQMMVGRGLN